jgi:uncharacterized protein (DUF486 family)
VTVVVFAAVVGLAGVTVERWSSRWPSREWMRWIVLPAVAAMALWIAGTSVASLWMPMPRLLPLEIAPAASASEYTRTVLTAIFTAGRLAEPDLLSWSSFFGGFGWLDTILPNSVIVFLTATLAALAVALLSFILATRSTRLGSAVLVSSLSIVGALIVYAVTSYGLVRDVHGRYLMGPYICGVVLFASAPAVAPGPVSPATRTSLLLLFISVANAFALWFVLVRYFG